MVSRTLSVALRLDEDTHVSGNGMLMKRAHARALRHEFTCCSSKVYYTLVCFAVWRGLEGSHESKPRNRLKNGTLASRRSKQIDNTKNRLAMEAEVPQPSAKKGCRTPTSNKQTKNTVCAPYEQRRIVAPGYTSPSAARMPPSYVPWSSWTAS
jgi:hypothetical protein